MTERVFGDILGQERAIETLTASIASGRIHHAWIFHGPMGVGKCSAARAFARALLSEAVRVQRGDALFAGHQPRETELPDLHIITKELARHSGDAQVRGRKLISIPKEVIEERLLAPSALAASRSVQSLMKKIFIVDEAELLNHTTQNALLKTLEEPPAGTVIILVTASEETLLPTIRSRCQRVAFGPLNHDAMRAWSERFDIGARGAELDWLLDFARGAPGLLMLAHEAGLATWAGRLEPLLSSTEQGRFDATLGATFAELVESWASGWVLRHQEDNPSKDAANKAGAARLLDLLSERARRELRAIVTADANDTAIADFDRASAERAMRRIDLVERVSRHIDANVNMKLALENLAAQLARV